MLKSPVFSTWSGVTIAWGIVAIFLVKAIILGFWIVPLWDIPDEIGHFAYAREIVSEGVLPLGQAKIDGDILANLYQKPTYQPENNWIAQHPPTYHILAGSIWKIATCFTDNPEWLFRAPRLASAIFGALTLLFIYKLIKVFHFGEKTSLAVMVIFSSIPMFSWLSSGTNHDTMVAMLGTASTYFFVLFFQNRKIRDAYFSVFLMSLAAATKITGLVVLAPLVGLLLLEIPCCSAQQWFKRAVLLISVALTLPGVWLIRNWIVYGDPFALASRLLPFAEKGTFLSKFCSPKLELSTPFFSFLQSQPAIEHFFVNFVGLMGGFGKGLGQSAMFQIQYPFLTLYELTGVFICLLAFTWYLKTIVLSFSQKNTNNVNFSIIDKVYTHSGRLSTYGIFSVLITAGCVLVFSHAIISSTVASWLIIPLFTLIFAVCFLAISVFVVPIQSKQRQIFYCALMFAFFSTVLFLRIHKGFLSWGVPRATHGRYYYPLLGIFIVGFIVPGLLMLGRFAERIALPVAIVICFNEAAFYFIKVLPYTMK